MMKMELKKHEEDLRFLQALERLTLSVIDEFRTRSKTIDLFPMAFALDIAAA
jgi:hypothetical protein